MKKWALLFFLIIGCTAHAKSLANPRAAIILVPGTFNSLVLGSTLDGNYSDYFSKHVISSIERENFEVFVVNKLSPIGTFEKNGEKVYHKMKTWYERRFPQSRVPIIMLGHSAGGLYAIHAASLNTTLPLTKIITVSTPIKGSKLINRTLSSVVPSSGLKILKKKLKGLSQLSSARVTKFFLNTKIDSKIQLFSVSGSQRRAPGLFRLLESQYIMPALHFTSSIIGELSDGIISVDSAKGEGVGVLNRDFGTTSFEDLSGEFHLQLDHPEQVLDYRYFYLFGTFNKKYIRDSQTRFYGNLINRVFSL